MPSFQKIGGLLANSMEIDAATLHAAVIAINQAVTEKVRPLLASLKEFEFRITDRCSLRIVTKY